MQEAKYHITQLQDEMVPLASGSSMAPDLLWIYSVLAVIGVLICLGILFYQVQKRQRREEKALEEKVLRGLGSLDLLRGNIF